MWVFFAGPWQNRGSPTHLDTIVSGSRWFIVPPHRGSQARFTVRLLEVLRYAFWGIKIAIERAYEKLSIAITIQ